MTRSLLRVLTAGTALTLGLFAMVPAATAAAPVAGHVASAGALPADPVALDTAASGPTLRLDALSPTVVRPGDVLRLTVRVDNPTDTAITDAELELGAGWKALTTRSALDDWVSGVGRLPTTQVTTDVPDIAPGSGVVVALELDVDRLSINGNQRAPRTLSVALRHGRDIAAELRSFLLWDPSTDSGITGDDDVALSILAPVTGPTTDQADPDSAADLGSADTGWMADATAPGGRLAQILAAVDVAETSTGTTGALSLALDPALVASGLTSPVTWISSWAHAASLLAETTDVHPLPPFDPDLAALAHAGLTADALRDAVNATLPGGWETPAAWGDMLAWTADDQAPDLVTLAAARDAGLGTAVLPSGLTPVRGTDTGVADVETPSGLVRALIADPTISRSLLEATTSSSAPPASPTLAVQRLLAETVVISAQNTGSEPHLLAVLPRDWAPNLDTMNTALHALATSGWVRVAPLSELMNATAPDVQRRPLADSTTQAGELSPDDVHRLATARATLREFASITADPDDLTAPFTTALAAPVSVAGRSQSPQARSTAVSLAVDAVDALKDNLSIAATDATLISARGDLPVIVSNDLDVDVTVRVALRPDSPRLVVEPTPLTTVPARSQSRVNVPVQALSSGDVDVTVDVLTASGTPVAAPITLQLAVRAGWETVGTAVAAGIVALLLIVGIVRTIRRGRSPRRAVDVDVPDPLLPGGAP